MFLTYKIIVISNSYFISFLTDASLCFCYQIHHIRLYYQSGELAKKNIVWIIDRRIQFCFQPSQEIII